MKEEMDIAYIIKHAKSIMRNLIWPDGPTCPDCGSHDYTRQKDGRYYCRGCGRKYSLKKGTIFENSHMPLEKWLIALYIMLTNNGVSSPILAKYLHTTQPTAFYMMHKLRFLFTQEDTKIEGDEIAIDEMYTGGTWSRFSLKKRQALLERYMLPANPKNAREKMAIGNRVNSLYKTPVIAINNGDSIILKVSPKPVTQENVLDIFKHHVQEGSHTVSDCSTLYDNWHELTGCDISYNNHSKAQFKAPDGRSSNKVEGTISHWKRDSLDKHCAITPRLLQLYLDEQSFRFNTRKLTTLERLRQALKHIRQKVTTQTLRDYDSLFGKKNNIHLFNPWEFFRRHGSLITEYIDNHVVYRRSDFLICR